MVNKQLVVMMGLFFIFVDGCTSSLDDYIEYRVLATVTKFSVPDSSRGNNIRVTMGGLLGKTTAYSLLEIVSQRTDTLFEFGVFAKQVDRYGETYQEKDITYDTTLVITYQPSRAKMHYFKITGSNGIFTDSSYVY